MDRLTRPNVSVDVTAAQFMGREVKLQDINDRLLDLVLNGPTLNAVSKDVLRQIIRQLYGALKKYEDMEEQGRLVLPPCKVRDHVFINGILGVGEAEEHIITKVNRYEDENGVRWYFYADLVGTDGESWVRFFDDQLGKTVFLTREEAEKALKEGVK